MAARISSRPAGASEGRRAMLSAYLEIGASGVFLVAVVVVSLISFLYLLQVGSVATTGYEIRDLENRKAELSRENEQLRFQQAQLQSLSRIEAIATSRLGMQRGTQPQFLALQGQPAVGMASGQQDSDGAVGQIASGAGVPAESDPARATRERP